MLFGSSGYLAQTAAAEAEAAVTEAVAALSIFQSIDCSVTQARLSYDIQYIHHRNRPYMLPCILCVVLYVFTATDRIIIQNKPSSLIFYPTSNVVSNQFQYWRMME